MNIRQITDGKEDYIELLRMGDPKTTGRPVC